MISRLEIIFTFSSFRDESSVILVHIRRVLSASVRDGTVWNHIRVVESSRTIFVGRFDNRPASQHLFQRESPSFYAALRSSSATNVRANRATRHREVYYANSRCHSRRVRLLKHEFRITGLLYAHDI